MTRPAEIEAHIGSMSELSSIVSAMRTLAGMRLQEAQRSLPGVRRYADTIAAAIASSILLLRPPEPAAAPRRRRALILCTAEHGFVGGFNERLAEALEKDVRPDDVLFVLGSRGGAVAHERGRPASWSHAMATRSGAVPEMVQRLSTALYRRIAGGEIDTVEIIHARHRPGSPATIERRRLLPLDDAVLPARRPGQAPLHNLDAASLHESLLAEYVFALLSEAAVESIASENAARFAAMASAFDNIGRRLDALRREAHQARQAETTTEILELVTATKALGATP